MKRSIYLSGIAVALLACLVGVSDAAPELAEGWGLDFWNYSKFERELSACMRADERLSASQRQASWRTEYRASLVEDLVARRSTVEQVIRQYQDLNRNGPAKLELLRSLHRTTDERRIAARQLVLALGDYPRDNARRDQLVAEIERSMRSVPEASPDPAVRRSK